MSLELTLLRLSKDRQRFLRLTPDVPADGLEESTALVLKALQSFYNQHPDIASLDAVRLEAFRVYVETVKYKTLPEDKLSLVLSVIDAMKLDVPPDMENGMVERLLSVECVQRSLTRIKEWHNGGEVDIVADLAGITEQISARMNRRSRTPLVQSNPEDLMLEDMDDSGLKFRLSCLSDNMRGLRGGDFGILAARPDAGKTTFLCSESTFWLPQLDLLWPGEGRTGVWLNNEGPGGRIKKRWYQALLNMTTVELAELVERGRMEGEPLFTQAIKAAMGMPIDRMLFYDIHDMNSTEVERIIKQSNAGFVIFDMLDNVKFHGLTANGGERTDQILEAQYQSGRNWCVKYDCIGVATSQLSVDGEGNRHPGQHMLKDSKTGKQGACDFIITLGKDNSPEFHRSRWVNTPKNKLTRPGKRRDPRAEVTFDADRARVNNPGE